MPIDPASPSATVPDWSREEKSTFEWSPSRSLLASLRSYHRWKPRGILGMPSTGTATSVYRLYPITPARAAKRAAAYDIRPASPSICNVVAVGKYASSVATPIAAKLQRIAECVLILESLADSEINLSFFLCYVSNSP